MANKENLQISESLIGSEECETIYLKEDEINAFLEKYLKEHPDSDVEHRFVKPEVKPEEYTQNVEVRWLRPVTPPEASPIIIREGTPIQAPEEPPLRIVELPKKQPDSPPPLIIREAPPTYKTSPSDPKVIYVPSQRVPTFTEKLETKGEQKLTDVLREVRSEKHEETRSRVENNSVSSINWSNFEESIRKYEEQQKLKETELIKKANYTENQNYSEQYRQQQHFLEEEKRLNTIKQLQLDEEKQHKIRLQKIEELKQQEMARQKRFEEITRQELLRYQQTLEESFNKVHIEKKPEVPTMNIQQQIYEEKLRKQQEEKRRQDIERLQQQQQKYTEAASYYTSLSQSEINKTLQYTGHDNISDQLKKQSQFEQSQLKKKIEEDQLKLKQAEYLRQQQHQQQAHVIPVTLIEKTRRSSSNSNIANPSVYETAKASYDYYDYYESSAKSSSSNITDLSSAANVLTKFPSNSNLTGTKVNNLIR